MSLINPNASQIAAMATSLSGAGTELAKTQATALSGFLEYVVDYFTFGLVRRQRVEDYDDFAKSMTAALQAANSKDNSLTVPEKVIVDFHGYQVTFTQPPESSGKADDVAVEVSKGGKKIESTVKKFKFRRICTVLLLRQQFNLARKDAILTSEGRMNLEGVKWAGANLQGIDLSGVDLQGKDLSGSNLTGANLSKTKLNEANLSGATLIKADLSDADLCKANLTGANLEESQLVSVNLFETDLTGACLKRATLSKANLCGAILTGADLSNLPKQGPWLFFLPDRRFSIDEVPMDFFEGASNHPKLLKTIDSIEDTHPEVKLIMVRELLASPQSYQVWSLHRGFFSKPPYKDDPVIAGRIGLMKGRG